MDASLLARALVAALLLGAAPLRADTTTSLSNANGTFKVTTDITDKPNKIKIEFEPDADAVDCSKIVLVQTVKRYLDDELVAKPSDVQPKWDYKDDDTVDGTGVDHLFCEKDAGYNGDDKQDGGKKGSAAGDGSDPTSSEMSDSPHYPDSTFNRTGKGSVRLEFEVCAVCVEGTQAGTNYGCIKWKYERSKGDDDKGTSTLVSESVGTASTAFTTALTKFNDNHTDADDNKICPEEKAAEDCATGASEKVAPLTLRVTDAHAVDVADAGIKTGEGPGDLVAPLRTGDDLLAGAWAHCPSGKRLGVHRTGDGEPGPGPLLATFTELLQGGLETIETGQCPGFLHGGVRVMNALGLPLAAAAPDDQPSPGALLLYTAVADVGAQTVVFRNDPLSTHGLLVVDETTTFSTVLPPGQSIELAYPGQMFPPVQPEPGVTACYGDGTGNPCPCDNDSPDLGAGCVSSSGRGMSIRGQGSASLAADDLVLVVEDCPPGNSGIFYAGTALIPGGNPLYEGLQCAAGDVRRFQGLFQVNGVASDTGFVAQDPSGVYFVPGETYTYQYWSRDVQTENHGCSAVPGVGANFSPGYRVVYVP